MTRLVVLAGFLVAFAAGLAVGVKSYRATAQPTTRPSRHGGGWLVAELNLTPEQQQELDKIWSETARSGEREQGQKRRDLERERDAAIADLIRQEDKAKYEAIQKKYSEDRSALERQWRESFQAAVERTKQILTPEQRTKYEELLRKHEAEHAGRRHHGEHERRGEHRPASRPMSASRPAAQP